MGINEDWVWLLVTRVLSNEATPDENKKLKAWIDEDPDHKKQFETIKASWNQNPGDITFLFDYVRGADRLQTKIIGAEKSKKTRLLAPVYRKNQQRFKPLKIAASIVFLIGLLSIFLVLQYGKPEQMVYVASSVEKRIITLPDGSQVQLNANSKISFPKDFEGSKREVALEGEAFFEVEKNPQKPFLVHTNETVVKVLGTAFSIKGSIEGKKGTSNVLVVVQEGVVSFRKDPSDKNGVKLRKGYLGYLSGKDHTIHVEKANIDNYFSWMNGHLSFDNVLFTEVLTQLDRIYGIRNVVSDSSLASLRLIAYTNSASLNEVLNMIAMSLEISYQRKGNTVIWTTSNKRNQKENK